MFYTGNPLVGRLDWKPTSIGKSIVVVPPPTLRWWYSGNPLTGRIDWKPTFIGSTTVAGQYRLLVPHTLKGGVYYEANSIVTEAVEIPANWVPSLAVDPLNTRAVNAFYAAGPRRGGYYEDVNNLPYIQFAFNTPIAPATFWKNTFGNTWVLTGLGSNLPPVNAPNN